jgi:hypothetical protein
MEATLKKLIDLVDKQIENRRANDPDRRHTPRIVKTSFAGQVICHLEAPDAGFPVAPAWCLTDKELIVATYPQNIKSYLSRAASFQSLATVPDVAQAVERGAVGLSYCDTRKLAEFVYPFLCFGSRALSAEMNREAIPLDASLLPSAAAIFPHLQPSLAVVRRTAAGVEITSRGPLAGMNAGPVLPLSFTWRCSTTPTP